MATDVLVLHSINSLEETYRFNSTSNMDRNNYYNNQYRFPAPPPMFDPNLPPPNFGMYQPQEYSMPMYNPDPRQYSYSNNGLPQSYRGQRNRGGYRRGRGQGHHFTYRNNSEMETHNVEQDWNSNDKFSTDRQQFQNNEQEFKNPTDTEAVQSRSVSNNNETVKNESGSHSYRNNVGGVLLSDIEKAESRSRKNNNSANYNQRKSKEHMNVSDKGGYKSKNSGDLHTSLRDKRKMNKNTSDDQRQFKLSDSAGVDTTEDNHGNSMNYKGDSYNVKAKADDKGQRYGRAGSAPLVRSSGGRQNQNRSGRGRQYNNDRYSQRNNSGGYPHDHGHSRTYDISNVSEGKLEPKMVNLRTAIDGYREMTSTRDDDNVLRSKENVGTNKKNWNKSEKQRENRGQYKKPAVARTLSGKVDESQRGLLIEQLTNGTYECMVCFDLVRGHNAIWSCRGCFHVFHLRCIKKWARSSTTEGKENGWRCPACQNLCEQLPWQYWCFCGKLRDPEWHRMETPHSCGEVCRKSRGDNCPHACNILCHPGPCPPCNAVIKRSCDCGKSSQTMKCSIIEKVSCEKVCGKDLNCGKHFCKITCHGGSCRPCAEIIHQECYKGHKSRDVLCGSKESFVESFGCGSICNRTLECGNHTCELPCHPGDCDQCALSPTLVTNCPCGEKKLTEISETTRKSCLDPIATCDAICNKKLTCGPPGKEHTCQKVCHTGPCDTCDGKTLLECRCGSWEKEFPCNEAQQYNAENPFCCDKRCNRKRKCGKHKCGQLCCVREEHPCDLICGKKLSCGLHNCDEPCHRGNCPPCLMASFEELHCHCGAEVLFPPIACGTKPPECHRKCTKSHACDHPVRHNCNSEPECPPCTELTSKYCMGNHELRRNIPCHITNISCGLPCNKPLVCEQHNCIKVCHKGSCQSEGDICTQPCKTIRKECGHICGIQCHSGSPCPPATCKAEILIKCGCGRREAKVPCNMGGVTSADTTDYQKMTMQNLASSMSNMGSGQSVDIGQLTKQKKRKLDCDETCAMEERRRQLAWAFDIKNPDLTGKTGPPPYTDFLKDYAKNNPHHLASIEKAFSDLVNNAKESKFLSRSHSFPTMKSDQRKVIHELAEFYGCKTQSYDFEPKKNVVATAFKDKCWLPSVTLTALVQRELHPKAPTPIPHVHSEDAIRRSAAAAKLSTNVLEEKKFVYKPPAKRLTEEKKKESEEKVIDYFDFT